MANHIHYNTIGMLDIYMYTDALALQPKLTHQCRSTVLQKKDKS